MAVDTPIKRARSYKQLEVVALTEELSHLVFPRHLAELVSEPLVAARANNMIGLRTACVAGLGAAVLPCFMADGDPHLRRLSQTRLWDDYGMWLLIHGDLRQTARVRRFVDFLADAITAKRAHYEGRSTGRRAR